MMRVIDEENEDCLAIIIFLCDEINDWNILISCTTIILMENERERNENYHNSQLIRYN